MGRYTSEDSLVGVWKDGNYIWLSFPARFGCLAWGLSQPGFLSQVYHTLGEDRCQDDFEIDGFDVEVGPLLCEHRRGRGRHRQLPRGQHSQYVSSQLILQRERSETRMYLDLEISIQFIE